MEIETPKTPLLMIILSGFGVYRNENFRQYTPNLNEFISNYPATVLKTEPKENMHTNSKLGHRILGTGRSALPLEQKISTQVESEKFFDKQKVQEIEGKLEQNSKNHLFVSLTEVFRLNHLFALLDLSDTGDSQTFLHIVVDSDSLDSVQDRQKLRKIKKKITELKNASLVSLINLESVKRKEGYEELKSIYNVLTDSEAEYGVKFDDLIQFTKKRSDFDIAINSESDDITIEQKNSLIFCDHSGRHLRDLVKSFSLPVCSFERVYKDLDVFTLVEYEKNLPVESIYSRNIFHENLTEIIDKNDLSQLYLTDSLKHPYLNYYFKGNVIDSFSHEEVETISLSKSYFDNGKDSTSKKITNKLLQKLQKKEQEVFIVEFSDFVRFRKNKQKKKALKNIDKSISKLVENVMVQGGISVITSDYKQEINGHSEYKHVPLTAICNEYLGLSFPSAKVPAGNINLAKPTGDLRDVAPMVLNLLGIDIPEKMEKDGDNLLI
ncbi:MAG: hypothetical protein ABEJ24_03340 [Candidatus Magasanikbacteria bacterium]